MTSARPTGVARRSALGLPPAIRACLFDLDGVLTRTERVHAAAWKEMFDEYLRARARPGLPFAPFEHDDYLRFVDGKTRADGVRSFLGSRGIELPDGVPDDPVARETVQGLGNRKNDLVLALIARMGVEVYEGSVRYVRRRSRGAASRSGRLLERELPRRARGARISPPSSTSWSTASSPSEAPQREAGAGHVPRRGERARRPPARAAVFEDAAAGVEAGRAGGFGFVVGVDRSSRPMRFETTAPTSSSEISRSSSGALSAAAYAVEPWSVRETGLDLRRSRAPSRYSRCRTGTLACARTSTRASRSRCPGRT